MKKLQVTYVALGATAAVAFGATSATADGYRRDSAPPCCAPAPWSGFYFGLHGGYGWENDDFSKSAFSSPHGAFNVGGIDSKGAVWGAQAGYNWQHGNLVTGIELDFSLTNIKGSSAPVTIFDPPFINPAQQRTRADDVNYLGSVRGRLGLTAMNGVLFYGTGGLAWERLERIRTSQDPTSTTVTSEPFDHFGWVAGLGAEAKLTGNWVARLEYLHYDFANGESQDVGAIIHEHVGNQTIEVVRAGLSYKLGGASGAGEYGGGSVKDGVCCAAGPWAGFYLGAHGGYAWKDNDFSQVFNGDPLNRIGGIKSKGGLWGAQAGYNWQYGNLVAGVEVDFSLANIDGVSNTASSLVSVPNLTVASTDKLADDVKYLGSARARLGFAALDGVLFYGTGGLAWERYNRTDTFTNATTFAQQPLQNSSSLNISTTPFDRFGWVAGLGAEAKLTGNWVARVEYLHYDFGTVETATTVTSTSPNASFAENGGRQTIEVVRAGLSYKFGATGADRYAGASLKDDGCCARAPWGGYYAGVHGGYAWKDNDFKDDSFDGISSKGAVYGLQAGHNWQYGSAVAGVEIDFSASNIKGSSTFHNGGFSETLADDVKYLGSARARLGYAPSGSLLFYGTGGLAWERFDRINTSGGGGIANEVLTTPEDRFGWVAGVGAEAKLTGNWVSRLEYLHYDFGMVENESTSAFTSAGISVSSQSNGGTQRIDVLRAGISYKF